MKTFKLKLLTVIFSTIALKPTPLFSQSNAAPSSHLNFYFTNDAVLKMGKIKITQSAYATYFETQSFTNGYAGLQQTKDNSKGSNYTLISSLWDVNTASGIYSTVDYKASNTYTGRFGGEGDGYQSINPYNWVTDTWYNIVIRSWRNNGQLHIATFINDITNNTWFHTATMSIPNTTSYLGKNNDAFLENWTGTDASQDGRFVRKMYLKDYWNLSSTGAWQKPYSVYFSSNSGDATRNGIYDLSFNSEYDATEDAYFMQIGGSTTPSAAIGTGRTVYLPTQTNQGTIPTISTGAITAVTVNNTSKKTIVNWTIDQSLSPQLSATVELLNANNIVLYSYIDTLPQRRSDTLSTNFTSGTYYARVTIRDIFNNVSQSVSTSFTSLGDVDTSKYYKIRNVSSGKYLSVLDSSNTDLANITQYTNANSYTMQWKIVDNGQSYSFVNRKSNKALDLTNGAQTLNTKLIQNTLSNTTSQQWQLLAVAANTYNIQTNLPTGYIIDNPASSQSNGTIMALYSKNGTNGTSNQQWGFEIASEDNTLPIYVSKFYGMQRSNGISLFWNTTNETNSKNFDLQKSSDGQNFQTIQTIASYNKGQTDQQYTYKDLTPNIGKNYYRLKLIDLDNTYQYGSEIIQITYNPEKKTPLVIFPNPANDLINVNMSNEKGILTVTNISGKNVYSKTVNNTSLLHINITSFPPGIYYLSINDKKGIFIKNK